MLKIVKMQQFLLIFLTLFFCHTFARETTKRQVYYLLLSSILNWLIRTFFSSLAGGWWSYTIPGWSRQSLFWTCETKVWKKRNSSSGSGIAVSSSSGTILGKMFNIYRQLFVITWCRNQRGPHKWWCHWCWGSRQWNRFPNWEVQKMPGKHYLIEEKHHNHKSSS